LFLSVAVATLSLGLSQGYAQQAGALGGEAAKQGESARPEKPGEQGAAGQRGERAQQQGREHGAREQKSERQGAAARDDDKDDKDDKRAAAKEEKKNEAAKGDERNQAASDDDRDNGNGKGKGKGKSKAAKSDDGRGAGKKGERHGAAKNDDRRGASTEDRDLTPSARDERRERMGGAERRGAGPETGAATIDNERRATQAGRDRTDRTGERAGTASDDDAGRRARQAETDRAGRAGETGQMQGRGDLDRQGREAFESRGARGRDAYGYAGRDARGGGRLHVSQRDNIRIRQVLAQQNIQRISPTVFSPRIGAALPPGVQFYPVPADILAFAPQFRGFNYVMVGDDFAIIDPGSREVVAVLDEGGPGAAYGYADEEERGFERGGRRAYGSADRDDSRRFSRRDDDEDDRAGRRRGEAYGYAPRVRLDDRQERALYRGVMSEARTNLRQVCVRVGDRVPDSVDLEPVPRTIAAEAPDVERYDYFVLNDRVVLVDPDTRIVVDMIDRPR
jgi:hypothetical protein